MSAKATLTWELTISQARAVESILGAVVVGETDNLLADPGALVDYNNAYIELSRALSTAGLSVPARSRPRLVVERDDEPPAAGGLRLTNKELLALRAVFGATSPSALADKLENVSYVHLSSAWQEIKREVTDRGLQYEPQRGSLLSD